MLRAANEETFSACSDPCVFFPLAAPEGVPENSRLEFATKNVAPHQGSAWSNSGKALGIREVVWENGGGSDDSARYYDLQSGRFLSEDPVRFRAGYNFYAYSLNNPSNFRDPSGKTAAAVALPIAEGTGTVICFGSGICETIIIGTAAVVAVAATGYAIYNYFARTKPKADPIPWPGYKDPGKCDDEQKCKPCPPPSPYWDQKGKPGTHGSPTGVHFHWYVYNQKPYPDCECIPARLDGPNPPAGGTPYTPGGPTWP